MNFKIDNKFDIFVGQFCISKSGRDKNKYYIVYEIVNDNYVLLINGSDRKINNPKKKNIKHLQKINDIVEDFENRKVNNKIDDLNIKNFIKEKMKEANIVK